MPPKDNESLLDNVYFGIPSGDGGYEYKPIGKVEHVDITDTSSMLPRLGEDMYSHFCKVKPGTTKLGWVAITEIIWHGNDLYLRFPKKAKRKLNRYNRNRRKFHLRSSIQYTKVFDNRLLYEEYLKEEKNNDI